MATTSKHIHEPKEKRALTLRLRKIIGQLHSVEKMVEDDRDCVEVLNQIVSARRALKSFAEIVIHQHSHDCIASAANAKDAHKKLNDLLLVLERYVE